MNQVVLYELYRDTNTNDKSINISDSHNELRTCLSSSHSDPIFEMITREKKCVNQEKWKKKIDESAMDGKKPKSRECGRWWRCGEDDVWRGGTGHTRRRPATHRRPPHLWLIVWVPCTLYLLFVIMNVKRWVLQSFKTKNILSHICIKPKHYKLNERCSSSSYRY